MDCYSEIEMLEAVPLMTLVLDDEFNIKYANTNFFMMAKKNTEEILGRNLSEFMGANTYNDFYSNYNTLIEKGEDHFETFHYLLIDPDNRVLVKAYYGLLKTNDKTHHIICSMEFAQDSLSKKEIQKNMILELAPFPLVISSISKNTILYINESAADFFAADRKRIQNVNVYENYVYPEDRDRIIQKLLKDEKISNYEVQVRKRDGCEIWALVSASIIEFQNEPAAIMSFNDITERKEIEEVLRKSEEMYRVMTENIDDIVWQMDREMRFTYVSHADQKLRGFKSEEVIGRYIWECLSPAFEESFKKIKEKRDRDEIRGIRMKTRKYELEYKCKDGKYIWAEASINPIYDYKGVLVGYRGVTRDVTKRKRYELEINRNYSNQKLLTNILQMLYKPDDMDKAVYRILRMIGEHLGVESVFINEDTTDGKYSFKRYEWICDGGYSKSYKELDVIAYETVPNLKKMLLVYGMVSAEDIERLPKDIKEIYRDIDVKSLLIIPMLVKNKVFGYVGLKNYTIKHKWKEHEISLLKNISRVISNAVLLNQAEKQLKLYATTDLMTGFMNRRTGISMLESLLKLYNRNKKSISICYIDIDGLKHVNDSFGHREGDELIVSISRIIKCTVRESDLISRIGGDEFLIVFPDCNKDEAEKIWAKIRIKMEEENRRLIKPYAVSASHGIEEIKAGSTKSIDEIIEIADARMYEEKKMLKQLYVQQ